MSFALKRKNVANCVILCKINKIAVSDKNGTNSFENLTSVIL